MIFKFRILDGGDKKIIYPKDVEYVELFNDGSWGFYIPSNSSCVDDDIPYLTNRDGILMWGTGIVDINGDEIYEGDIIQSVNSKKVYVAKIPDIYRHDYGGAVKIIGNIYKNPELIEDQNVQNTR